MTTVETVNAEIATEIKDVSVQKALLATTFKGLDLQKMRQAMVEGMLRGFSFKDFLEKNVYAIPYGSTYSLITSIDYIRKIAMRSGLVGKSAPQFAYTKDGALESCTITIKRKVEEYVGEYTATADFKEYTTSRNLWEKKPKTMLAKVAEMQALRSAFPEEMAKQYIVEEMDKETNKNLLPEVKVAEYEEKLKATTTEVELKKAWAAIPVKAKTELKPLQLELKKKYADKKVSE